MRSNSVRQSGSIVDTPSHDLECYDLLDPRIREFLAEKTPDKTSAAVILRWQGRFGVDAVLARLPELVQKEHPGFEPVVPLGPPRRSTIRASHRVRRRVRSNG